MQTTIILVHGAFAESSSWRGVAARLTPDHHVIAYANPLRGIVSDAAGLSELVRTVEGPVVLVGHSYGGAVITALSPDVGELSAWCTSPRSPLSPARAPPPLHRWFPAAP